MRILLDENVPVDLASELPGHQVATVVGLGWAGIKNGELLRRSAEQFEALVTMDTKISPKPVGSPKAVHVSSRKV